MPYRHMIHGMLLLGLAPLLALTAGAARAETPQEQGLRIMTAVDQLPVFEKVQQQNELRIYDNQNKLLFVKQLRSAQYYQEYADPQKRLSRSLNYFFAPADDKGNSTLTIELADADDDEQYLYLKQTRKVRRIIGSSKSDDFMGSDFALSDIAPRDLDDYTFTWQGSEAVAFKGASIQTEKIESVFKSARKRQDYNEGKSVIWVHPASGVVFQAERYDTTLALTRRMNVRNIAKGANRDGKPVYYPTVIEMANLSRGTHSEFIVTGRQTEGETQLDPAIFTTEFLTRQWW